MNRIVPVVLLLPIYLSTHTLAHAESKLLEVGIRGGASVQNEREDIDQYELFTTFSLPWQWQWPNKNWVLSTQQHVRIGGLVSDDDEGVVVSIAAGLTLSKPNGRFGIDIGSGPTYISEDEYGPHDLGGNFQFTSHIRLRYKLTDHFSIGYRYHHISNAGIDSPNPGLDVQSLDLSYWY